MVVKFKLKILSLVWLWLHLRRYFTQLVALLLSRIHDEGTPTEWPATEEVWLAEGVFWHTIFSKEKRCYPHGAGSKILNFV